MGFLIENKEKHTRVLLNNTCVRFSYVQIAGLSTDLSAGG